VKRQEKVEPQLGNVEMPSYIAAPLSLTVAVPGKKYIKIYAEHITRPLELLVVLFICASGTAH
jgi:hypothetical protein